MAFHDALAASADRLVRRGRYLPLSTHLRPSTTEPLAHPSLEVRAKLDVVHPIPEEPQAETAFLAPS